MASSTKVSRLFQTWLRGEWGKARWETPVKAEATQMATCASCNAAFVSATKSELCEDCR